MDMLSALVLQQRLVQKWMWYLIRICSSQFKDHKNYNESVIKALNYADRFSQFSLWGFCNLNGKIHQNIETFSDLDI